MKKKHRELNIFSLSALDIFCCALGVFMILCLTVFRTEDSGQEKAEPFFSAGLIWEHQFTSAGNVIKADMHDLDLIITQGDRDFNYETGLPTDTEAGHLGDARNTGCEMCIIPSVVPGATYKISAVVHSLESRYPAAPEGAQSYTVDKANDILRLILFITRHDSKPERHTFELKLNKVEKDASIDLATIAVGDNGNLNITYH